MKNPLRTRTAQLNPVGQTCFRPVDFSGSNKMDKIKTTKHLFLLRIRKNSEIKPRIYFRWKIFFKKSIESWCINGEGKALQSASIKKKIGKTKQIY